MNSRNKAEIQRVCDAGLASYLAQQHSDFRLRCFSRGVIGGVVLAIPAYFLLSYYHLNPVLTVLPLFGGVVGGTYRGLTQAESEDKLNIVDFDEVCASVEEEEEETDEESDEETSE